MYNKTFFLFFLIIALSLNAQEKTEHPNTTFKESFSETNHTVKIQGKELSYKATAGNLLLNDDKGSPTASIFFVSYIKQNDASNHHRPITFCFNGGPGAASLFLNIGAFGPRKISWDENTSAAPPYTLMDNPDSILDLTDLVFIDPVSTGHSVALPGQDPKQFYGVEEDIKSVAEFIRLFLTKYKRWNSPKYIAGESYGTTRAAGLCYQLQDDFGIYLNGVILISSVLNWQTRNPSSTNDLPYMLYLPTYTATAWYHKKLSNEAQKDFSKIIRQSEEFALGDFALALLKGDKLEKEMRAKVISKLAFLTGLPAQYIDRANLRIEPLRFAKELLKDEKRIIGRFDGRYKGIDVDVCTQNYYYDPSFSRIIAVFAGSFNEYLLNELKWENPEHYIVLANLYNLWNWGKSNQTIDMVEDLKRSMVENSDLKVFVASGYYDLAIPYFSTNFTFDHLGIDPSLASRFFLHTYDAGHMMYLSLPSLIKLRKDLEKFYNP